MFARLNSSLDAVFCGYIPRYARRSARFLRSHAGKILYYMLVAAALCAIAYAAEIYRSQPAEPASQPSRQVDSILETVEVRVVPLAGNLPSDVHLLRGYSGSPQWNGECSLWEVHPATDCVMSAAYALLSGTVSECGMHPVYGGYVRIDTGEFEILYASLLPDPSISAGMYVRAGDLIGVPDSSMPSESYMGDHLHVEVVQNGKHQNLHTLQVESKLMD